MTKEQVYDEQIKPLMDQVEALATANEINFATVFQLSETLHVSGADITQDHSEYLDMIVRVMTSYIPKEELQHD